MQQNIGHIRVLELMRNENAEINLNIVTNQPFF